MNTMKRYLLGIIGLLSLITLQAKDYSFKYYFTIINGHDGLSQTDIKAILQDSEGFMWFGTRNKLNRFDGNSIQVFDCYDSIANKRNNNISSLYEDKNKHLWIGTDKGIFIFNPVYETFTFVNDSTKSGIKMKDWVSDIREDADGNIWIVLPNQGLFRYDSDGLVHYPFGDPKLPDQGNPQCLCVDRSGRLWVGTNGKGVYLYNRENDKFTQYLGDNSGETLFGENIYKMCDYGDELVIGIHEGKLRKLNKRKNTLTDVNAPEVHYKIIRDVACFDDELWVGTQSGVYVINELKNKISHIYNDPMCSYSLSDNQIGRIYRDRENGIWIGTNLGGVNYCPQRGIEFTRYIPLSRPYTISSKRVRELVEDEEGNIWVGTEDAGINIYDPHTGAFKKIGRDVGSKSVCEKSLALLADKNYIWAGSFKNGLDIIDRRNFSVRHYSGEQLGLNEASIYALCEDRKGKIWIGNAWGVYVGDKKTMTFTRLPQFGLSYIFDIIEDSDGYIWVATMGNGVYKYNPEDRKIKHYMHREGDDVSLSSNSVSNIKETSSGEIWFSTDRGGVCRYNKTEDNFTTFSEKQGLPDDTAYKILEDKNRNLWFGTNKGLVKFDPETGQSEVFTTDNGLPGDQFNYKSAFVSSSGIFYFGSSEGLISFDPYQMQKNSCIPSVFITKLLIGNKEVTPRSENSPLQKSILYTDKITLNYDQASIGFEFVTLSYVSPSANVYAYKMDNIDDDWVYTRDNHNVSYANIPPGKYTFRVKGANNDGLWNESGAVVEITVLPPWWKSPLAYVIYCILAVLIFYLWFRWYKSRSEIKSAEKQQLFESEKEKELYSSKIDFFTHIAHEIRTPVTLINGPLESMLEMNITDPEIKKNLQIMSRNTSELLALINQLLDFRKMDGNQMQMNFVSLNVVDILKDEYQRFEAMALSENRHMELILPEFDIYVLADRSSLIKILNNLFSNAIRYSDDKIIIKVEPGEPDFKIVFLNDGQLVPVELREKIFDPFYQMKKDANALSSSGIGLSLARSLSELHHGSLILEERDGMNCFVLRLPVAQNVEKSDTLSLNEDFLPEDSVIDDEKQNTEVVLIVEDNVELLHFMVDKLKQQFIVEQAQNGVEALKILEEKNIDLVVSDIIMPEMDGFELCRNIKSNIEFCHIPVVLLTAKNDLDSKIEGLKMGADVYIEKPFSFQYLLAQLTSLFDNRKREKEAFMRKPFLPVTSMGMSKADEELMNKLIGIIEDNITDPNFGVERLSEIVFMSRSSLHRKIKVIAGTSPADFIRLIRLKKATELIIDGRHRIGEICFLVGINSPSYFIKLFQKQFGMTPKEFEKQQRQSS